MDGHPDSKKLPIYTVFISMIAALGGFLFGFDSGVINGTIGALQTTFQSSDAGTGLSVASMLLGSAAGAVVAGRLADRFGRKPTMIATAVAFFVSAFGCGVISTEGPFIFFRLLGGLAVGAASVLAPAYIAEVSPAEYRGRLASLQQLAIVVGLFSAFLSNYVIVRIAGSAMEPFLGGIEAWRWMFWVECGPALLFGLGIALAPESPRYLLAVGRDAEAEEVLRRVHIGSPVQQKAQEIRDSLRGDAPRSFRDVLVPGTWLVRRIVVVGIILSAFQQLVGINVIFYYGAVLWEAVGFSEDQALLTNLISGAVNITATFVAISLVDRLGRRPLLLAGSLGMTLMLGAVAVVFSLGGRDDAGRLVLSREMAIAAIIFVHLYIFAFAVSWGPVVWVMLGEMFDNRIRGAALGIAAAAQWIANFIVTMTFPVMLGTIGLGGAYGVYTVASVASALFVFWHIQETKGREIEDM